MKHKKFIFEIIILIFIGLVPLLWFQKDNIILGHDAGLTLSPISHFQDRLNSWTERFGFGNDQSYAIPGFFIHGLEAFVSWIGFSIQEVQKITFVFWFLLPGFTMYYFSSRLEKKLKLHYFALPVSIFYIFNHFLLQGWFVAERTKFSLYAALPLLLAFLFDWKEKGQTFKTALLLSLTFFFLNGMASLPLFGGVIVTLLVFLIFYFLENFSIKGLVRLISLFLLIGILSFLLQAYWLLPYGYYVSHSYSDAVTFFGGTAGIQEWIRYISENSSFLNLFRLQGVPEWYQNPDHPYAGIFFSNPIFVFISFLLPIGAFYPLLISKEQEKKKIVLFFSFLALFSMIFVAGSHPPFGAFYLLLIKYIPGFIAFRTPFYKFAPALWLSYAVLLGFTFDYVLHNVRSKGYVRFRLLYLSLIALLLAYSFPFFTGIFFDYIKGQRTMRVSVPNYIYDFARWTENKDNINEKMIVLPRPNKESKVEAYTWGYWSLAPLTSLLTNAPIINESIYMTKTEIGIVDKFYELLKNNDPAWNRLAEFLGIKYIILRNDFAWNLKDSIADNPALYKKSLLMNNLKPIVTFGAWEVYQLEGIKSNIVASSTINYFKGPAESIGEIVSLPVFDPTKPLYVEGSTSSVETELMPHVFATYIKPTCSMCDLQWEFINTALYIPLLTRGSYFYSFWNNKEIQEEIKASSSISTMIQYYSGKTLSELLAYRKVADEKKPAGILQETLDDYAYSLRKLEKTISEYSKKENYDNDLLLKLATYLRNQRIIALGLVKNPPKDYTSAELIGIKQKMIQRYQDIERNQDKVDKMLWRSTSEIHKRFLITITQKKDFTIFYNPNYSQFNSAITLKLHIDKNIYEVKPVVLDSNWISLGNYTLEEGVHRVEIEQPIQNLYNGPKQLTIKASVKGACAVSNKIHGRKNEIYKLSFDHRRITGAKEFYVGIVSAEKKITPFLAADRLLSQAVPVGYTQEFAIQNNNDLFIIFCDQPDIDSESLISSIQIENLRISKLNVPDMVLFSQEEKEKQAILKEVTKKSSSEYLLKFTSRKEKAKFLVLNESYNISWELEAKDTRKFIANGYANGWLINDSKENVRIRYKNQDFVRIGFLISIFGLTLSVILLIFLHKRNETKN